MQKVLLPVYLFPRPKLESSLSFLAKSNPAFGIIPIETPTMPSSQVVKEGRRRLYRVVAGM